jgi:hypothetical protein
MVVLIQADTTERQVVATVWRDIQHLLGGGETAAEVTIRSVTRIDCCCQHAAVQQEMGFPLLAA